MAWVKLDDKSWSHPKLVEAGLAARGLDVAAISWSASHETDGFVPESMLNLIAGGDRAARRLAGILERVGRWDRRESGWEIHDFLTYNPSRAQLDDDRAAARSRMSRRRRRPDGAFGECSPEHPPNNGRSSEDVQPPRPVPSRPVTTSRPVSELQRTSATGVDETEFEVHNPEVAKVTDWLQEAITTHGGRSDPECTLVARWVLGHVDVRLIDQWIGEALQRNGKPRSARYFVAVFLEHAAGVGIELGPYEARR